MLNKGLNRDIDPKNQPEGTYRDAKNGSLTRKQGALVGERGTSNVDITLGVGSDKNILGTCNLPNGKICIFSKQEYDEIGIFDPETNTYDPVYRSENTGFDVGHSIQATAKLSDDGDIVVYWTDGLNEPRRLNLEREDYSGIDADDLSLFLTVSGVPKTEDLEVRDSGGILKTGTYQVALCYETTNGDRSPFVYVSEPITVGDDVDGSENAAVAMDGAPADTGTGKSIFLEIAGLDPRYEYVRPALIRGSEVRLLNRVTTYKGEVEGGFSVGRLTIEESAPSVPANPAISTIEINSGIPEDATKASGYGTLSINGQLQGGTTSTSGTFDAVFYDGSGVEVAREQISYNSGEDGATIASAMAGPLSVALANWSVGAENTSPAEVHYDATEYGDEYNGYRIKVENDTGNQIGYTTNLESVGGEDAGQAVPTDTISFEPIQSVNFGVGVNLNKGMSAAQVAQGYVDQLNANTSFNNNFTAVRSTTTVEITANTSGFEYNGPVRGEGQDIRNGYDMPSGANITGTYLEGGTAQGGSFFDQPRFFVEFGSAMFAGGTIVLESNIPDIIEASGETAGQIKGGDSAEQIAAKLANSVNEADYPFTVSVDGATIVVTTKNETSTFDGETVEYEAGDVTVAVNEGQIGPEESGSRITYKASLTVSGGESYTPSSLEEITIDPETYETAQTLEQDAGMLYLGNLKKSPDIGFQKYANAIKVEAVIENVDVISESPFKTEAGINYYSGHKNDYRNASVQFKKKGFKRNEVYAFYISLVLKDGTETPAYHIPGRSPVNGEDQTELISSHPAYDELDSPKRFHIGTPNIVNGMGYWENENERYPSQLADEGGNFEVWEVDASGNGYKVSSLHGQNVRHHKMPDPYHSPFVEESGVGKALGVRLRNINIPDHILERISGYKVHYAKRTIENSRWVDQSPLYPVEYNTEATNGYNISHDPHVTPGDVEDDKYKGAYPFNMLRSNMNEGVIRYMQKVGEFQKDHYDATGDIKVMIPESPDINGQLGEISTIDWASYIDMNAETFVGSGEGDEYLNKFGSKHLLLEAPSPDGTNEGHHKTVDFFSHKVDIYYPFHAQELVYTGYAENVDIDSSSGRSLQSGNVYGGDTFVSFYGLFVCEPILINGELQGAKSIQQCIIESPDNIGLRHQGSGRYEIYYPKMEIGGDDRFQQGDYSTRVGPDEPREALHFIGYNDEYSKLNTLKPAFPFNPQSNKRTQFPNRIARSVEPSEDLGDNFRKFLQESHHDLTGRKGGIRKLTAFSGMLLIHTERSLFRTIGREEMTVDGTRTFIGSGDILSQPPKEVYSSPEGYGGVFNHKHAALTPQGYFFADIRAGKIFQLADGLKEISSQGMRDFFLNNLDGDMRIGYDPQDNKVFFTHHGENPYTISYLPAIKGWESFHSGIPDVYFWGQKYLYCQHDDNLGNPEIWCRGDRRISGYEVGKYFDGLEDLEIEVVYNQKPFQEKVLHSVIVDGIFGNRTNPPKTISVSDGIDQTGIKDIIYFTEPDGNARRTNGVWRINGLRSDDTSNSGTMPAWIRRRMIGQWWKIKLTAEARNAHIHAVAANTQPSIR